MTFEDFLQLFTGVIKEAVLEASRKNLIAFPLECKVLFHGLGRNGEEISLENAAKLLYINDTFFYKIIDVYIIKRDAQYSYVFVRPSGHSPGEWAFTWNPEGAGPFRVLEDV